MLFTPKKTKFKKRQKGKRLNTITKVCSLYRLSFGRLGLKAMDCGHLNSKQINAIRQTINKMIKKKGKLKVNIFPNTQISKKPLEVRMGKGKGNVSHWVAKIRGGSVLFEVCGINRKNAIKAFKTGSAKLPVKTQIFD